MKLQRVNTLLNLNVLSDRLMLGKIVTSLIKGCVPVIHFISHESMKCLFIFIELQYGFSKQKKPELNYSLGNNCNGDDTNRLLLIRWYF